MIENLTLGAGRLSLVLGNDATQRFDSWARVVASGIGTVEAPDADAAIKVAAEEYIRAPADSAVVGRDVGSWPEAGVVGIDRARLKLG